MVQFSPSGKIVKGSESSMSLGEGAAAAGGTWGGGAVVSTSIGLPGEGETALVEERRLDGLGVAVAAAALAAVGFS